jgi:hypothetical protein
MLCSRSQLLYVSSGDRGEELLLTADTAERSWSYSREREQDDLLPKQSGERFGKR